TPFIATGDELGCFAYGSKSNGLAWSIWLDRGIRVAWNGPPIDTSWSIQVDHTPVTESVLSGEVASASVGLDTLSQQVFEQFGPRASTWPGPRSGLATFALEAAATTLIDDTEVGIETLGGAPLGSRGLRVLPGRETQCVIGMRPAHRLADRTRATFEGLCFEVARWRNQVGFTADGELPRLALGGPWTPELSQLAVDIICEPLMVWAADPTMVVLLGQSLALIRDLGLGEPVPSVSLSLLAPRVTAAS